MADGSVGNDNTICVVCFKTVQYYSVGECDHPVCFECSTRMRVLCLQNECPICRQAQGRVIFTDTVQPYKELRSRVYADRLFERQFKIGFCSEEIKNAYEHLLENRCAVCTKMPPFRNFGGLSDHMRKVHERYFCDLCVKHLRIFTNERKCYTRQELAHHRRKGDLDDTSHRGHPLCEFCEERFMDADELYRHLRKEHLFCHLCDADGRNYYYATHAALAQHFRTDHHLCEEGECADSHLTAVFRTDIDLKAHKASVHGKGLTRAAARQGRTLELQFNIAPHAAAGAPRGQRAPVQEEVLNPAPVQVPSPRIDTRSDQDFPRLSAAAPAPRLLPGPERAYRGVEGLARTDRNFPSLDGGGSASGGGGPSRPPPVTATLKSANKPSISIKLQNAPTSASQFRLTQPTGSRISAPPPARRRLDDDEDFPSLGGAPWDDHPSLGAGTVQPAKVTMINSQEMQALKKNQHHQQAKKPQLNSEAFPALSATAAPAAAPQWIKVSKSKEKSKPANPSPPPQPRDPQFNPVADFPTLPVTNNKAKAKKPTPPPQPPEPPKQTKKEKKKEKQSESKKENITKANNVTVERKNERDSSSILANMNSNQSAAEAVSNIKTVAEVEERSRNGGNGDFTLANNDYPTLPVARPPPGLNVNGRAPPGLNGRAPPGLNGRVPLGLNGRVPPGFSGKRPACDGLKFTNSAGQTFSAPLHTYISPPNFESRNRALVKKFAAALGGAAAVEDFKVASRAFRDSVITADDFYEHCQAAMGSLLHGVFPELVALLPDIGKQQELVVGRRAAAELAVCATCGQLLAREDLAPHDTAHWPVLGAR